MKSKLLKLFKELKKADTGVLKQTLCVMIHTRQDLVNSKCIQFIEKELKKRGVEICIDEFQAMRNKEI